MNDLCADWHERITKLEKLKLEIDSGVGILSSRTVATLLHINNRIKEYKELYNAHCDNNNASLDPNIYLDLVELQRIHDFNFIHTDSHFFGGL